MATLKYFNTTTQQWEQVSGGGSSDNGGGSGDVVGPATSENNHITAFDGTNGKLLKSTNWLISDAELESPSGDINFNDGSGQMIVPSAYIYGAGVQTNTISEVNPDSGVTIDGVLVKDGLVDGRDVSVDGTKLDGIATGAQVNDVTQTNTVSLTNKTINGASNTITGLIATTALTATGTKSSATYLRGDNTWATPTNTTYAIPTQAEAEAGTATTARAFSAQRVNQAIQALAPVKAADLAAKQDTLTSGGNIKTINGASLLGMGDINISPPTLNVGTANDVSLSNLADDEILVWDSAIGKWRNEAKPTGYVAQPEAPTDTDALWYDTDDEGPASSGSAYAMLNLLYPIGTLYTNRTDSRNPSIIFGFGTWVAVTDKMIMARGSTYTVDGGSATHNHPLTTAKANISAFGNTITMDRVTETLSGNVQINGTGAVNGTYEAAHKVSLSGNTDSGSNIPPMIVAYVWERTE